MRFGSIEIPGSLFKLARERMLAEATFTPEDIRRHLMSNAKTDLLKISVHPTNQWIVANRVMRAAVKQLVDAGEIAQLKRGVWARCDFLAAANK